MHAKRVVNESARVIQILNWLFVVIFCHPIWADDSTESAMKAPLSEAQQKSIHESLQKALTEAEATATEKPNSIQAYSRRGDAYFFLGDFEKAVADYDKMIELDPSISAEHWRRGIALFYAKRYEQAADQFERYHSFDQVDRENGIWRYLSQYRASGREVARKGLQKYKKDDREPFPAVYQLFGGTKTPEQILEEIAAADLSKEDREMRLFYANLYIGLNHAVEGNEKEAQRFLAQATQNRWGPRGGYGPTYMWHVGRLHESLLRNQDKK